MGPRGARAPLGLHLGLPLLSVLPQLSSSLISQTQTLTHDDRSSSCSSSGRFGNNTSQRFNVSSSSKSGDGRSSGRFGSFGFFTWVIYWVWFWYGFSGGFELILSWVSRWVLIDFELGFLIAYVDFGSTLWWIINYSNGLCWCWLGGARLRWWCWVGGWVVIFFFFLLLCFATRLLWMLGKRSSLTEER